MDIKQLGAGALFTIAAIIVLKIVAEKVGGGAQSLMSRV